VMSTTPARRVDHVENFTTTLEKIKPSSAHCHYEADRDINAARNILLRYLSLRSMTFKRSALGSRTSALCPYKPAIKLTQNGVTTKSILSNLDDVANF